jgi:hypothetical protein
MQSGLDFASIIHVRAWMRARMREGVCTTPRELARLSYPRASIHQSLSHQRNFRPKFMTSDSHELSDLLDSGLSSSIS